MTKKVLLKSGTLMCKVAIAVKVSELHQLDLFSLISLFSSY